jgi:hypothetical protein
LGEVEVVREPFSVEVRELLGGGFIALQNPAIELKDEVVGHGISG